MLAISMYPKDDKNYSYFLMYFYVVMSLFILKTWHLGNFC